MGYEVVEFDVEPEPYAKIAESCRVNVVGCDLERGELGVSSAKCVVFTEIWCTSTPTPPPPSRGLGVETEWLPHSHDVQPRPAF